MKKQKLIRLSTLLLVIAMCLSMTAFAAENSIMFDDVTEDEYFYEAVQWGLEQKLPMAWTIIPLTLWALSLVHRP